MDQPYLLAQVLKDLLFCKDYTLSYSLQLFIRELYRPYTVYYRVFLRILSAIDYDTH